MARVVRFAYLRDRWAVARLWRWWENLGAVLLICVMFVGAGLLIADGIDLLRAHVPGSVTVASCKQLKGGQWDCHGPFASDDGSVRIDWVRLYPPFPQDDRPTGTVPARVSGPEAAQADRSEGASPGILAGGIVMGLLGLFLAWAFYGTSLPSALRRSARPPSRGRAANGRVPQTTSARSRR